MMDRVECFFIQQTQFVRRSLRRYSFSVHRECSKAEDPGGGCDASVVIEDQLQQPLGEREYQRNPFWREFADDPRWPAACEACGQPFRPEDERQVNDHRLYGNAERGILCRVGHTAPVGAMWYAWWYEDHFTGPDGRCLVVMTPGGEWIIDSKSRDGGGWTREGAPPNVTARPSILIYNQDGSERYHGWLTDGVLVRC